MNKVKSPEFALKVVDEERQKVISNDIAFKELQLNIEHQNIKVKEFSQIGYEYDKGVYVCILMFPFNWLEEWQNERKKTYEHTMYMDVDADINIDVDIEYDDVHTYAFDNGKNFKEVEEMVLLNNTNMDTPFVVETMYDECKVEICKRAMNKYSLDQLERRLGLDWL